MSGYRLYDYDSDKEWSDKFTPEVGRILAPFLSRTATFEEDTKKATDVVGAVKGIGVRIREFRYWLNKDFRGQFTIRLARRTGARTEFEKIVSGRGDWFLYGFASNDGQKIPNWRLLDLGSFRTHWREHQRQIHWGDQNNGDGTEFRWFNVASFPANPPIQIACSAELEKLTQVLETPPLLPGWDRETIQNQKNFPGATVTKQEFEQLALDYARKGPRDEGSWRYKGAFTLPDRDKE